MPPPRLLLGTPSCGGGDIQPLPRLWLRAHQHASKSYRCHPDEQKKAQTKHLALPYHVAFIISIIAVWPRVVQVELMDQ